MSPRKRRQGTVGLDERFLRHIFHFGRIADEGTTGALICAGTSIPAVQRRACRLLRPLDQPLVGNFASLILNSFPVGCIVLFAESITQGTRQHAAHLYEQCSDRLYFTIVLALAGYCPMRPRAIVRALPTPIAPSRRTPFPTVSHRFDVLIIGSGLAGQSAALRLADTRRVAVISKRSVDISASAWAQGGIAAVLDSQDSIEGPISATPSKRVAT